MIEYDYIIVGSGLTGAVIARELSDAGKNVIVLERRSHLGGNLHDHFHPSGILVHTYGPHYFRTNDDKIWEFVNRFTDFYEYVPILKSIVDGEYENWPIAASYIKKNIGESWKPDFDGVATNFEEASLSMMPKLIYEKFVKGYTEKQWGVESKKLSASLAKRFDVREDDDPRLMKHKHQGIPSLGYSAFMERMLEGIPTILNFDYVKNRASVKPKKMLVFTGPIDEFFDFDIGKLKYRGQRRLSQYIPDVDYVQPVGQLNNPSLHAGDHIRSLEWKHMMNPKYKDLIKGTIVTTETTFTPENPTNYEYPFPDEENALLYKKYRERAEALDEILICGRLGEYKYYDMDQAIARARKLAKQI